MTIDLVCVVVYNLPMQTIKLLEGDSLPSIYVDLTRNGQKVAPSPGTYRVQVVLHSPDNTVETSVTTFEVVRQSAIDPRSQHPNVKVAGPSRNKRRKVKSRIAKRKRARRQHETHQN